MRILIKTCFCLLKKGSGTSSSQLLPKHVASVPVLQPSVKGTQRVPPFFRAKNVTVSFLWYLEYLTHLSLQIVSPWKKLRSDDCGDKFKRATWCSSSSPKALSRVWLQSQWILSPTVKCWHVLDHPKSPASFPFLRNGFEFAAHSLRLLRGNLWTVVYLSLVFFFNSLSFLSLLSVLFGPPSANMIHFIHRLRVQVIIWHWQSPAFV